MLRGVLVCVADGGDWREWCQIWKVSTRIDTFHETTNFRMPGDTVSFIPSTLDISPPSFTLLEIQDSKFGRFAERSILKSTELGSPFYQDLCNRCHSRKRLCSNECLQNVFESSWSCRTQQHLMIALKWYSPSTRCRLVAKTEKQGKVQKTRFFFSHLFHDKAW